MSALENKTIVLGVSGGIAAYKAVFLASLLVQDGAHVEVVMTEAAQRFVQPMTFSAVTRAPVHTDPFTPWTTEYSGHVSLATRADLVAIAPATAATIARLALGIAEDFLGLVVLASEAPLLIAPAMEARMYLHPATQQHLETLRKRGATIVAPEKGRLASGAIGEGRLAAPEVIAASIHGLLLPRGLLLGRKVVVTAGGTREPLDPVRFIANRSSGLMGFAIAKAALDAGATVTLISGPTALSSPDNATVIPVETALQMHAAVDEATLGADALIMAAAVSDFRPASPSGQKIKKEDNELHFELRLTRNPDIVASVSHPGLLKIGFAAETENLLDNAAQKLAAKGLAMIVANDAAATIGSPESEATFVFADGRVTSLPRMSKESLAREIIRQIPDLLGTRNRTEG